MLLVDAVEIGIRQRALAGEHLVDMLIERRIVAGGVGVPDFIVARISRLAQRLDLAERDLRERHRALVLVAARRHCPSPLASAIARGPPDSARRAGPYSTG